MVMAGTEGVSGLADESLTSRLQWLRQRREALQEKLAQKNSELKTLCIEEAELTGVLPPEIPLEPGESPPNFRKRVGTSYPQNVINKLKSNEAEESALELERQVQVGITEASLVIINDSLENKAVRRKHRLIYQQSQQRLQEVEARLNFIRQRNGGASRHILSSHSSVHGSQPHLLTNAKHRTKKPRPPLENTGKAASPKLESRILLQDQGGINLSPITPEHNYNYSSPDFQEFGSHSYSQTGSGTSLAHNHVPYPNASPVEHRHSNTKFIELDHNVNNNIYILPDQFRNRTYSQGGSSSSPRSQTHYPEFERPHRPVPNTYTEEERQMHYRQMQLQKQEAQELQSQQHPEYRYVDNDAPQRSSQPQYYETDLSNPRYSAQVHDYPVHYKARQSPTQRQQRDIENIVVGGPADRRSQRIIDPYVPPGYWKRVGDEIVWCPDEQVPDRFPTGSLDRRKQNLQHSTTPELQMRYHTVSVGGKNTSSMQHRQYSQVPQASQEVSPGRSLLRTQSLGSVETWHLNNESLDERESTDDNRSKCSKEKEWYETSLDARVSPISSTTLRGVRRASQHNPPAPSRERVLSGREAVRSNSIPTNRRERPIREHLPSPDEPPRPQYPQSRYNEPPRVLEIPAESKTQENGNEPILNSPTGHTVVQPGKYQPYREVTKPFEMSDFYKYSTKFRKRAEVMANTEQQPTSTASNPARMQNEQGIQKRVLQPIQRNACPSYALR